MNDELKKVLKELINNQFDNFRKEVNANFDNINVKLDEQKEILRALEHRAEVNSAEHDKMSNDIAHIMGDMKRLEKDVSTVEVISAKNNLDVAFLKAAK